MADAASPPTDPCALKWAHAAPMEAFYLHTQPVASFTSTYTVPEPPASVADNVLYYWIGLQSINSTLNPVIQPVLSYVPGASANNWCVARCTFCSPPRYPTLRHRYFESWNCCPAGHKLYAPTVGVSGPGAVLTGDMRRTADGAWLINSTNSSGASSVLISDDTNSGIVRTWNWVDLTLETCARHD
jgi:hypothetical protein